MQQRGVLKARGESNNTVTIGIDRLHITEYIIIIKNRPENNPTIVIKKINQLIVDLPLTPPSSIYRQKKVRKLFLNSKA